MYEIVISHLVAFIAGGLVGVFCMALLFLSKSTADDLD